MRVNIVPNLAALNNVGIKMQVSGTPVTKISVMIHLDSGLFTGYSRFYLTGLDFKQGVPSLDFKTYTIMIP